MKTRTINHLPAPTWRWLKMNEASLVLPSALPAAACEVQAPAELRTDACPVEAVPAAGGRHPDAPGTGAEAEPSADAQAGSRLADAPATVAKADPFADVETGCGAALDEALAGAGRERQVLHVDGRLGEPVRINLRFSGDSASAYGVELAPESEAVLIMDEAADGAASGTGVVQTKILAGRGASLTLVQVLRAGDSFTLVNDVGALCGEGAAIKVVHLILGGGRVYQGCRADLDGDRSRLQADVGYRVRGSEILDMNYVACHRGRRTESGIRAAGVLRDQASKLFRGTIDLQKGCAGAVGNEQEDVLIIDEMAVNRTIPLILCSEEDVVGNHGATIGRPDEDMMFYMASRGMSEEEIYAILSRARLDAVIRLIPDEETRQALARELGGQEPSESGKEEADD